MNDAFVAVDPARGTLRRYMGGGGATLLCTHEATHPDGGPVSFTVEVVEQFRTKPDEAFRIHQPPYQPSPPTNGSPAAMQVAA